MFQHSVQFYKCIPLLLIVLSCSPKINPVQEGHKYGVQNSEGEWLLKPQFNEISEFVNGMAKVSFKIVQKDSHFIQGFMNKPGFWDVSSYKVLRYSFITKEGELLPLELHEAKDFSKGVAAARIKGYWGFIDKKGAWAIEPMYRRVQSFKKSKTAVTLEKNNKWHALKINKNNKIVKQDEKGRRIPDRFDSIPNWSTLVASGHLYLRLTDYETSYEFYSAAARRLPEIESEDTLAYLSTCQNLCYLSAMRIEDKTHDFYYKKVNSKMAEVVAGTQPRRKKLIQENIDFLCEMAELRENNLQKEMQKEIYNRILNLEEQSGIEDLYIPWNIRQMLEELIED